MPGIEAGGKLCVCGGRNPWGWFAFSIGALCKQNLSIASMIRTSVFDFSTLTVLRRTETC